MIYQVVQFQRDPSTSTSHCPDIRKMPVSGPLFLRSLGRYTQNQFQPFFHGMEPCGTFSIRATHLYSTHGLDPNVKRKWQLHDQNIQNILSNLATFQQKLAFFMHPEAIRFKQNPLNDLGVPHMIMKYTQDVITPLVGSALGGLVKTRAEDS